MVLTKCSRSESELVKEYLNDLSENLSLDYKSFLRAKKSIEEPEVLQASLQQSFKERQPKIQIFNLFNETFISINNETFLTKYNGTLNKEFYKNFEHPENNFIKFYQYNGTGFVAVSTDNETFFYNFHPNNANVEFIQSISTPSSVDGHFFINNKNLYYISTRSNTIQTIGCITIYKWLGSYFDELDVVFKSGVGPIEIFSEKQSEIIVVGKKLLETSKVQSSVYQFKYDKLKTIQNLQTDNVVQINSFTKQGIRYIIIYQNGKEHMLYKWNGFEMIFKTTIKWGHKIEKSIIVYDNSKPLILHVTLEKLLIFEPQNDEIKLHKVKQFMEPYSVISDINKGENEKGNIIFIAGLSENNMINIYAMPLEAHTEMDTKQNEVLQNCLNNLAAKVYERREQLKQIKNTLPEVVFGVGNKEKRDIPVAINDTNTENKLNNIDHRLNRIRGILGNISENQFVFQNKVVIRGNITAQSVNAQFMNFNKTNGRNWTPGLWLRHNGSQTINGPVKINDITAKALVTRDNASELFHFLRKSGNQNLSGNFQIQDFSAKTISCGKINNISIDNIVTLNDADIIKGLKSFYNITWKTANITLLNNAHNSTVFNENSTFAPHVTIDELDVKSIDNINWTEFVNSLFIIGTDDTINGNLTISRVETNNLKTNNINGINPKDLLTKSTDQNINSTIRFEKVTAGNVTCETVNNVDPSKIIEISQNVTVKGHVKSNTIEVLGDFELQTNQNDTNDFKYMQIYTGKVIIYGDLYVDNFTTATNATLVSNTTKFSMDYLNQFWKKSKNQTIPGNLQALKGITVSHLKTKNINDVPIERFSKNNASTIKGTFYFENVTVTGNITLNNLTNDSFNPEKLALESVFKNGNSYTLRGKKIFKNKIKARRIESQKISIEQLKQFKQLCIEGNLNANINSQIINDININNSVNNMLSLEKSENLTHLALESLNIQNLFVKNINTYNIQEYLNKLQDILKTKQILELNVTGNVTLNNTVDLKMINGHDIEEIFERGIEINTPLNRTCKFKNVKINNLQAVIINNIDFPNLTKNLFYNDSNVPITAKYTFNSLKTKHLNTTTINGKNVENLIDVTKKQVQTLKLDNVVLRNSKIQNIQADLMVPCDIYQAINKIRYPETRMWESVEITGNVTFLDNNCDVPRILEKSLKKDEEYIILAPVEVDGDIIAETVNITSTLNDVNLSELLEDVVLKDSEELQIIEGFKTFNNETYADVITVMENSDILKINDINITQLYEQIINKDEIDNITITGHKTFYAGLEIKNLFTKSIAGVNPENIVNFLNVKMIPTAIFDTIDIIHDFEVQSINNFDVNDILSNRILLNCTNRCVTSGIYYFNELDILENLSTTSINNIEMKHVIFDIEKQKITSQKGFEEDVMVSGNVTIGDINHINIDLAYKSTEQYDSDGKTITILKPVRFEVNISAQRISNFTIEDIQNMIDTTPIDVEKEELFGMSKKIKSTIKTSMKSLNGSQSELLYIENSQDLQISTGYSVNAKVIKIKDHTLIHIISEESHINCNLPKGCMCLSQDSINISPDLSVSSFAEKALQRTFSYDNDDITLHFITNSTTTSSYCRQSHDNILNETSTLIWSSSTQNGSSYVYDQFSTGYISGVEFFTLNGVPYVIVCQYYDVKLNKHDLGCMVLRFSYDKKNISTIQHISIRRAWTLYLLHTAQGIVLVIGNRAEQPSTDIYRFNNNTEQFQLLRSIPMECTKVAGVTLGDDSLILIGNEKAPLMVLKYNLAYDNYQYLQQIFLNEPILGISVFYIGDFGISEAYLCIVTENNYQIYSYQYIDGWKLDATGIIRGLRNLIPLEIDDQLYLFAASTEKSFLLKIVQYRS
ncbi:hypothetical protein ABEB36_011235 [Hypothenemus hampei]|uniref:Uncharacterized protein n=1 Tax=Hypothenemus hampei TaxID=57062 RepID=A0ABD1EEP8_HYPHA